MRRAEIVDEPPVLEPIRPKSYIMWGRHAPILRTEWADNGDENFDDVTVEIAEDTGHFVHCQQPELADTHMRAFFESLAND